MKTPFLLIGGALFLLSGCTIQQQINIPIDWTTSSGQALHFSYPKEFGATVRKMNKRPLTLQTIASGQDALQVGCPLLAQSGAPLSRSTGTNKQGIGYTLYTGGNIGAGTLYTSACYVFDYQETKYVLDFEIRSHSGCGDNNCGAYCETVHEQACKDFSMTKDVLSPIQMMIDSIRAI